jgi:HEXXH motif-containing protein
MFSYTFAPDAQRARDLDRVRHSDLAQSLRHIADRCQAALPAVSNALSLLLARLDAGDQLAAEAFGDYYTLTEALIDGDREVALQTAQRLSNAASRSERLIVRYRGATDNLALDQSLNQRLGEGSEFAPLPQEDAPDFPQLLNEGFALLREGFEALYLETRTIVHQVVLAQAPKGSKFEFDGASHFQFWGLLFLNPKHHKNRLAVAEVLAHEAGHSLLFGLMRDEPLVKNPESDLYTSPLRVDPRPMEGIYHATFVSARMALAMETLAQSGVLTSAERAEAQLAAEKDRENFAKGISTVHEHGNMTDSGKQIMDHAEVWINKG